MAAPLPRPRNSLNINHLRTSKKKKKNTCQAPPHPVDSSHVDRARSGPLHPHHFEAARLRALSRGVHEVGRQAAWPSKPMGKKD